MGVEHLDDGARGGGERREAQAPPFGVVTDAPGPGGGMRQGVLPFIRARLVAEGPPSVAMQPAPIDHDVCHYTSGRPITAIVRRWAPGDSGPGGRCRLCRSCCARNDLCLIVVGRHVARDEAPLFSTVGLRDQRPGGRAGVALGEVR
jgi:hypothetical protein